MAIGASWGSFPGARAGVAHLVEVAAAAADAGPGMELHPGLKDTTPFLPPGRPPRILRTDRS